MYLPKELIEDTLRDSGHKSKTRLLGRDWKNLLSPEELEYQLKQAIELDELTEYSFETGNDFIIHGRGYSINVQEAIELDLTDPDPSNDYNYHEGYFALIGNAWTKTFTQLHSHFESYRNRRDNMERYNRKKTSRPNREELHRIVNQFLHPLQHMAATSADVIVYDGKEINPKEEGLTEDDIFEEYLATEILPKEVRSWRAWIDVNAITEEGLYGMNTSVYFHGTAHEPIPFHLERDVIKYILERRIGFQIPVDEYVEQHYLKPDDKSRAAFAHLMDLYDDPRPNINQSDYA